MEKLLHSIQAYNPSIQKPSFLFDLAPYPQRNIGIDDDHTWDSQANNCFINDLDYSSSMALYRHNFFPFDNTPSQQQNIDFISNQLSVILSKTYISTQTPIEMTCLRGSREVTVETVNLTRSTSLSEPM